jgi:hypothetical protein
MSSMAYYSGLRACKSRPEAASRPATEAAGGICVLYVRSNSVKVKTPLGAADRSADIAPRGGTVRIAIL